MERKGEWMQTFTGVQFYPLDPHPDDVDIRDIAHHLSLICRYNGAVSQFFSVAEHSTMLSYIVPSNLALVALLHDASEAYTGDMTRPMKLNMGDVWKDIERGIEQVIAEKYALAWPWHSTVMEYDTRICNDERSVLMVGKAMWRPMGDPLGVYVRGLAAPDAEREFMLRFDELMKRPTTKPAQITEHGDDGAEIPAFLKMKPVYVPNEPM